MKKFNNRNPTVLLAGSSGTIGTFLINELAKRDYNIICPIRNDKKNDKILGDNLRNVLKVKVKKFDKIFVKKFFTDFSGIDVIISCIGSRSGTLQEAIEVEYQANIYLLELAQLFKVKQFILLSAICVQKPRLFFQKYKLKFENALINSKIHYTIVRPTAYYKSLSGQIERVLNDKSFIVFDGGFNNKCKPISERDLSNFICQKILNNMAYRRIYMIGGPGPALTPRMQGALLFELTGKPQKFFSVPSSIFRIASILISLLSIFSKKAGDYSQFLKIAHFYATESMLSWDSKKRCYNENETPEFGEDSLREYYYSQLKNINEEPPTAEIRLFDKF